MNKGNPHVEPDDCPPFQVWVDSYGRNPVSALREHLDKHIAGCSSCAKKKASLVQIVLGVDLSLGE